MHISAKYSTDQQNSNTELELCRQVKQALEILSQRLANPTSSNHPTNSNSTCLAWGACCIQNRPMHIRYITHYLMERVHCGCNCLIPRHSLVFCNTVLVSSKLSPTELSATENVRGIVFEH